MQVGETTKDTWDGMDEPDVFYCHHSLAIFSYFFPQVQAVTDEHLLTGDLSLCIHNCILLQNFSSKSLPLFLFELKCTSQNCIFCYQFMETVVQTADKAK